MESQKRSGLTVDDIRSQKGLEHLTDEEAQEAINTIEKFTDVMFDMLKKEILNNQKKPK